MKTLAVKAKAYFFNRCAQVVAAAALAVGSVKQAAAQTDPPESFTIDFEGIQEAVFVQATPAVAMGMKILTAVIVLFFIIKLVKRFVGTGG